MYYHGTSLRAARDIVTNGFDPYQHKNWTVSENATYFWSPDALVAHEECEEDYKDERAVRNAFESSQCAIASERVDCRCVVFGVDLPDEDVEQDLSCENMDCAVVYHGEIKPELIKEIYISPDFGFVRGYLIAMVNNFDLFNGDFSDFELRVAAQFTDHIEELYDAELDLVDRQTILSI